MPETEKKEYIVYIRPKDGADMIAVVFDPIQSEVASAFKAHLQSRTPLTRALEFDSHVKREDGTYRHFHHVVDLDLIYEIRFE